MDNKALATLAKSGDRAALEEIVEKNSRLIWSIVHRFKGRGVEVEDLYQIGSMGLIKAARGYDEAFGTEFSTYATPKIIGEIRRFLRDDGMIKVSRDVKRQGAIINAVRARLEQEGEGDVHISRIAQETGMSVEEIAYAQSAVSDAFSIDASLTEDGFSLEDTLSEKHTEEKMMDKIDLKTAMEKLPQREKTVIILRFFKDLTQQKTATVMGLSQVQVSRIEKKALELMKSVMI